MTQNERLYFIHNTMLLLKASKTHWLPSGSIIFIHVYVNKGYVHYIIIILN